MLIMAAAGTAWYLDSKLWVAIPLILFFAFILSKGAHKAIGAALDDRSEKIKNELEEARRLREEARALLASFNRKQKEAEEQAEEIVRQARLDAEVMAEKARKDLAERLARRTQQAEAKIASAEAKALADVRARAADMALDAAEKMMRETLNSGDHSKLVKTGISQLGDLMN